VETLETSALRLREKTNGLWIGVALQSAFISHRLALDCLRDVIDFEVFTDTLVGDVPWRTDDFP